MYTKGGKSAHITLCIQYVYVVHLSVQMHHSETLYIFLMTIKWYWFFLFRPNTKKKYMYIKQSFETRVFIAVSFDFWFQISDDYFGWFFLTLPGVRSFTPRIIVFFFIDDLKAFHGILAEQTIYDCKMQNAMIVMIITISVRGECN